MNTIGLTGGIGTGKSTASKYLITKGFAHIDADAIGRELTMDGSPMLDVLNSVFGPDGEMGTGEEILDENGSLRRAVMASIVFADQDKIEHLNDIMFKAIIDIIKERITSIKQSASACTNQCGSPDTNQSVTSCTDQNASANPVAILIDAPLLFEAGLDEICDYTILITADLDTRIDRVCARDQVAREDVEARIRRQMSDDEKARLADYIVDNSGTHEELYAQLDKLLSQIL